MKILLLLLSSLWFLACASQKQKKEDEEKAPPQRIVGRIASVSKAGQFVLIQKYGAGVLPSNALFQSRGPDGRTAALRPSGERVRDFFAADLLSGSPQKGDAVFAYPVTPQKKEEAPEPPESPEPKDAESSAIGQKNQGKNNQDSEIIKEPR